MISITDAYDAKNYKVLKDLAHALKGACAYIGASRLHYVCFFMQEHYILERYEKVVDLYPSLVEAAIEYKLYSREILAKHKGENYQPLPEHEYIPIPSDFRLEKDPTTNYTYCCFKNQPLNQRIYAKSKEPTKPKQIFGERGDNNDNDEQSQNNES